MKTHVWPLISYQLKQEENPLKTYQTLKQAPCLCDWTQGASGTNSSTANHPIKPQSPRRVQCRTLSASPHFHSINTPKQKEEAVMRELQGEQWWGKGRTQWLSDTWKWAELLLFLLLLSFAWVRVGRSTSLCVFDVCVCVRACVPAAGSRSSPHYLKAQWWDVTSQLVHRKWNAWFT